MALIVNIDGEWHHYTFVGDSNEIVPLEKRDEDHAAVFLTRSDDLIDYILGQTDR